MENLSKNKRLLLEKMLRGEARRQSRELPIEPRNPNAPVPLAPCQTQIWLHAQLNPQIGLYNEPMTIHFRGRLDRDALNRAFQEVIQRHEIWRTTFAYVDGQVVQAIHASLPIEIPFHDLTDLAEEIRAEEATRLATNDAARPFDLGVGPLIRARLFKLAEESYRLYVVMHHLIHDGASIYRVLMSELPAIYDAFAAGKASPLETPRVQYADFAIWQKRFFDNDLAAPQVEYWKKQLAGELRPLEIPTDESRPAAFSFRGEAADFLISAEMAARIKTAAQSEAVTPFIFLLAAFKAVLFRYTGQTDLLIGTLVDNRNRDEFTSTPGFSINSVALRSKPEADKTFRSFLAEVKESVLGGIANKDVPIDRLVRELRIPRDSSRHPIFQAMFNLEPASENGDPRWKLTQSEVCSGTSKLDLDVQLDEHEGGYSVRVVYCPDLFRRATIERIFRNWMTLVDGAVACTETKLGDLPLLTADEVRELCVERNATARAIPPMTIHELFEAQVEKTPDRIAVVAGVISLKFDELNRRANRLARRLREEGAGPGTIVALSAGRSTNMVVAVLAALKSGAAYLPIDPALPEERRRFILQDSQVQLILTERELAGDFSGGTVRAVFCDEGSGPDSNPEPAARPDDIAHVLYTSGSTGKPKGVEIPHRAVVNFLQSMQREPGFRAADTILAVTTLSFDIAGLEMYLPLSVGGRIVLANNIEARDPHLLRDLFQKVRPTVMQATPATWRALIDAGWSGSPRLKILCGGEALPRDLADQLLARSGELWNMYGPTETTIWSAITRVESGGAVSIGKPIDNTAVFVLDSRLRPVPVGVTGEIYIGGAGVARGYLNRPELTAQKFVRCEAAPGMRLYRTGDLGRWRHDGTLDCLGRTDNQVKIRGFRIELEEVEAVLARHPAVRAAAVKPWPDASGNLVLAGYLVAEGSPDMRGFLRDKLPDYMIPSRFIYVETLPLTPNLKVDRHRLPEPEFSKDGAGFVPAANPIERKLAGIWESVLRIDQVGARDNFFDLGGHSLLIPKLMSRIEDAFGARLPMSCLFEAPTIAELAKRLPAERAMEETPRVAPLARVPRPSHPIQWIYPGTEMRGIMECLGPDRPLCYPRLSAADEARLGDNFTLSDLAGCLAADIRVQQPHGPYSIGGWCDSGVLAYEVALHLLSQGCEVDVLVLLDSLNPAIHQAQRWRWRASKLMFHLREIATVRGEELRKYIQNRRTWMREQLQPGLDLSGPTFAARFARALLAYKPPVYPGRVLAISPERCPRFRDPKLHWRDLVTGPFEKRIVPGTHFTMFEMDGGARHIAASISGAMRPAARPRLAAGGRVRRAG